MLSVILFSNQGHPWSYKEMYLFHICPECLWVFFGYLIDFNYFSLTKTIAKFEKQSKQVKSRLLKGVYMVSVILHWFSIALFSNQNHPLSVTIIILVKKWYGCIWTGETIYPILQLDTNERKGTALLKKTKIIASFFIISFLCYYVLRTFNVSFKVNTSYLILQLTLHSNAIITGIQCRLSAWAHCAVAWGLHKHRNPMLIYVCCVQHVFFNV